MQLNPAGIRYCCDNVLQYEGMDDRSVEWFNRVWAKQAATNTLFNAQMFPGPVDVVSNEWCRYLITSVELSSILSSYSTLDGIRCFVAELTIEDLFYRSSLSLRRDAVVGQYLDFESHIRTTTVGIQISEDQIPYMYKDGLVFVDSITAMADIQELLDWMRNVPNAIPRDVTRLGYRQARAQSLVWHVAVRARLQKAALAETVERVELGQIEIEPELFRDPGEKPVRIKLTVHEMLNGAALAEEGERMSNCIGSYTDHIVYKRSRFFSLVNESRSHSYSMQVNPTLTSVQQIRGFANRVVPPWEATILYRALDSLGAGFSLTAPPLAKVRKT